jgi:hypothetical protein
MATSSAVTNTKSRFGVPLSGATGSGILQPKLKYRFRVSFLNFFGGAAETTVLTQNIQSVGRPNVSVEEIPVHSYNSRVYVQGKHEWQTIEVAIRDDISNRVAKLVGAQVQRQVNHFQQTTPAAANDFKFDMQIEVLDGVNAGASEVWFLEGCFLQTVAYGDHAYDGSEVQQITLTVRFDNALHFQGDNSVNGRVSGGNPFPQAVGTGVNRLA